MLINQHRFFLAGICAGLATTACAEPIVSIDILARSGDAAPDGNGTLSVFESAVISDSGHIAFIAGLTGTAGGLDEDDAVIIAGSSGLEIALRESGLAPDGNGQLGSFGIPSPVGGEAFAIVAALQNTAGGSADNTALLTFAAGGPGTVLAREADTVPDGNGELSSFDPIAHALSASSVFGAQLRDTAGGNADNAALLSVSATEPLSLVARGGQIIPAGDGAFGEFQSYATNASGDVIFAAELDGTPANQAVFLDQQGSLTQIAREDDPAPDGDGVLNRFGDPQVNDNQTIAFAADLSLTSAGSADDHVIYVSDAGGTLVEIIREGSASPDGNGTIATFAFDELSINNANQVLVSAVYNGSAAGSLDDSGLLIHDNGVTRSIAREGQQVPSGDGEFASIGRPSLAHSGQIAFGATLRNTASGGSVSGLFASDAHGRISEILRTGDSFDGGTVLSIGFVSDEFGRSGLGDDGSLVFTYVLEDLRGGLAVADVRCPADTNNDGSVTPADFNAWIQAFNTGTTACDQNGDGACTPADFNAWIANFNAGC